MKKAIAITLAFFVGCIQIQPTIQTTKTYEGHFYDKTSAEAAIKTAELQKGESIWILSNTTLKRVLKNCK